MWSAGSGVVWTSLPPAGYSTTSAVESVFGACPAWEDLATYVAERDLEAWAEVRQFPLIPCDLCGSQEDLKRKQVKQMLQDWNQRFPGSNDSMFAALGNIAPSLLLDRSLFNFSDLKADAASPDASVSDAEEDLL